jgi:hypothetical protein
MQVVPHPEQFPVRRPAASAVEGKIFTRFLVVIPSLAWEHVHVVPQNWIGINSATGHAHFRQRQRKRAATPWVKPRAPSAKQMAPRHELGISRRTNYWKKEELLSPHGLTPKHAEQPHG